MGDSGHRTTKEMIMVRLTSWICHGNWMVILMGVKHGDLMGLDLNKPWDSMVILLVMNDDKPMDLIWFEINFGIAMGISWDITNNRKM